MFLFLILNIQILLNIIYLKDMRPKYILIAMAILSLLVFLGKLFFVGKNNAIIQYKLNKINSDHHDLIESSNNSSNSIVPIINKIFDLTKPLTDDYKNVPCRLSKPISNVITTLCVHDLNEDIYVSSSIWNSGVWEEDIVKNVLLTLSRNPDSLFLDIGAQIGEYSLYAAKFGHDVLAVEPYYDSIIRIHKAAFSEKLGNKITLITNAISNKRGEIKLLNKMQRNIGGQGLIKNKNENFKKADVNQNDVNSKYFVETILLDDIVHSIPLKNDGSRYTKAVMKIDIEAFEPYGFQHAIKLFETLSILVIFMGNYKFNYFSLSIYLYN